MTEPHIQAVIQRRQAEGPGRKRRRRYPYTPPPTSDVAWGRRLIIGVILLLAGTVFTQIISVLLWVTPLPNRICWGLLVATYAVAGAGLWLLTMGHKTSLAWHRMGRWGARLKLTAYVVPGIMGLSLGPYAAIEEVPHWPGYVLIATQLISSLGAIFLADYSAKLSRLMGNKVLGGVFIVAKWIGILTLFSLGLKLISAFGDEGPQVTAALNREVLRLFGTHPMGRSSAGLSVADIIFPGRFILQAFYNWVSIFVWILVPYTWLAVTIRKQSKRTR